MTTSPSTCEIFSIIPLWEQSYRAEPVAGKKLEEARKEFSSARADTDQTLETIKTYYNKHGYMLCPHSAVGVDAIHQMKESEGGDDDLDLRTTVCLATAHDAKFPDACRLAVDPLPATPPQLAAVFTKKSRSSDCPNDAAVVQAFMEKRIEERILADKSKQDCGCPITAQVKKVATVAVAVGAIAILAQMLTKKR